MEYICKECNTKYDLEIINSVTERRIIYKCIVCGAKITEVSGNRDLLPKGVKFPSAEIALPGIVYTSLNDYIKQYKDMFDNFSFEKTLFKNGIENYVYGVIPKEGWNNLDMCGEKKTEKGTTGLRLRIFFLHEFKQAQIPNIMVPYFLKHQGIGKKMISLVYSACKQFDYRLFIVDLVESFYEKLLKRGANKVDLDTVEITEYTNLNLIKP
jgi:DNA-directed RNA polymerase subunit RPC12/RpoP